MYIDTHTHTAIYIHTQILIWDLHRPSGRGAKGRGRREEAAATLLCHQCSNSIGAAVATGFLPIFAFFVRASSIFAKNEKNKKFPGLNVNRLEIKQRAHRDMTFLILAFTFILAAKKMNFYGKK